VSVDAILDGDTTIKVEPGSQPGSVVTLRGKGMPHLRTGVRGNLHAHLDVVVPTRLDSKERELLKDFRTRHKDGAEVVWAESASGGVFSRLREAFTGR
jgi:molecular chaperone DnaJ